jgi:AcrR family transcriptional regulator
MAAERRYHHGQLRQALLDQAERVLRDGGVEQLSLRELARQVGVSHSAPRRHFPDRRALLDALAESGFLRLHEELLAASENAGKEFEDQLRAVAAAYVSFATRDPALLELMFASKHQEQAERLEEAAERAFSVMLALILGGQESGILQSGDPERVGLVLFATVQGIAALLTGGMVEPQRVEEMIGDAVKLFMSARIEQNGAAARGRRSPTGATVS